MKIQYPIAGYAPGNYSNRCSTCGDYFEGDKRSSQCEPCAINSLKESNESLLKELNRIKTIIANIFNIKNEN